MRSLRKLPTIFNCFKYSTYVVAKPDGVSWSAYDISEHIQALYGIELSAASISNITDKISDESKDWYSRTLDSFYPVIFLDAVHFKVREEGRIVTKAAYVALVLWRYAQYAIMMARIK